ncbi:hypothetical protein [Sphaerisporangium perillae]|uniref:hypothetical protein n=1 Tax=Sphaerisporangium perillae TaxID=2935860 RepID=UPI00200FD840|nr:hypothetical protein [Sphaerisporangium perillae]
MDSIIMREATRGMTSEVLDEGAKLLRLYEFLTGLGVAAELHEHMPALLLHRPDVGLPLWVFVGYGGAYFSWQSAEKRHPVADVPGAALALADYINGRVF